VRLARGDGIGMSRRLLKLPIGSWVLLLVALALWPRFRPPDFRYTGSDPARPVWNLGWPFVLAIYDATTGFHVGPVGFIAGYAAVSLGGAWVVAWGLMHQISALRVGREG
jgi:hypothetical protein